MTYLPTNTFKNILSYCDDRIECRQRQLWNSIRIKSFATIDTTSGVGINIYRRVRFSDGDTVKMIDYGLTPFNSSSNTLIDSITPNDFSNILYYYRHQSP